MKTLGKRVYSSSTFETPFQESQRYLNLCKQLLYLEDLREMHVDFLRDPVERDDIDAFLEDEVEKFKLMS